MNPKSHRLTHGEGRGRTEIRLVGGGEPLLVTESPRQCLAQLEDVAWAVLTLDDDESEVFVRPSNVAAIIDLDHTHGEAPHLRSLPHTDPAA